MMMMGEGVSVPPWSHHVPVSGVDIGGGVGCGDEMTPYLYAALRPYLPCNDAAAAAEAEGEEAADAAAMAAGVEGYGSDEFRMYEFKVRLCARPRSHDWTECPFAHSGEKARRRDPRKYHYSGTACPDFRKGGCKRGDNCDFAHGVFECWLHPARYRTQPCKDGTGCRRRVCFFAHTPDQLRVLPPTQHQQSSPRGAAACSPLAESYDGSPLRRHAYESYLTKSIMSSSPTSTLMSPPKSPPSESPPLSPDGAAAFRRGSWPGVGSPVNDVIATLRQLRLSKAKSSPSGGWGGYPASAVAYGSPTAGGLYSLPSTPRATPTALATASGYMANLEPLDVSFGGGDEPVERVESGRALRAKVLERLTREGAVSGDASAGIGGPDVGWVCDLIN